MSTNDSMTKTIGNITERLERRPQETPDRQQQPVRREVPQLSLCRAPLENEYSNTSQSLLRW